MNGGKVLVDLRGPQRRIGRLAHFHLEAFVHVLAYRILIPLAILYAAAIVLYLMAPGMGALLKVSTAVVWVLWTPQVFEVAKGLSLAATRGMAFGKLNKEFADLYRKRYPHWTAGFVAFPFVTLALWAAGFIVLLLRWMP
jgi:hypothetical protein